MNKTNKIKFLTILMVMLISISLVYFLFFQTKYRSIVFFTMDTFFELRMDQRDYNRFLEKEVKNEVKRIDFLLNSYQDFSEISQINKYAGLKPVKVSEETYHVIQKAIEYCKKSNGLFDITFQPLQDIYGFNDGKFHVPEKNEIKIAREKVNYKKIVLNPIFKTIYLSDKSMKINCSGFLKGYVLDCTSKLIKEKKISNFSINFGGNLYIRNNIKQKIGIKHPRENTVIKSFWIKEGFVSTSADYQQYFEKDGQRYTHIINPLTGSAQHTFETVTVLGLDGMLTDFLSTNLFLMEPYQVNDWLQSIDSKIYYYAFDGKKDYKNQWFLEP